MLWPLATTGSLERATGDWSTWLASLSRSSPQNRLAPLKAHRRPGPRHPVRGTPITGCSKSPHVQVGASYSTSRTGEDCQVVIVSFRLVEETGGSCAALAPPG